MTKMSPLLKWVGGLALVRNLDEIIMEELTPSGESKDYDESRLGSDKGMHKDYNSFMLVELEAGKGPQLKSKGIIGKNEEANFISYGSDDELESILKHYGSDEGAFAIIPDEGSVAHIEHYNSLPESRLSNHVNLDNYLRSLAGRGIFRYDETQDYSLIRKKIGTKFKAGTNVVELPEEYGVKSMVQLKGNVHSPLGMSAVVSYNRNGMLEVLQFLREEDIQGRDEVITDYIDDEKRIVCQYSVHQLGDDFRFRETSKRYLSRSDFGITGYVPAELYKAPVSANPGLSLPH